MVCYCRMVQRRDYRREVALSHLTAQTETYRYSSHHSNTTNLVHQKQQRRRRWCYAQTEVFSCLCFVLKGTVKSIELHIHVDERPCSQAQRSFLMSQDWSVCSHRFLVSTGKCRSTLRDRVLQSIKKIVSHFCPYLFTFQESNNKKKHQ